MKRATGLILLAAALVSFFLMQRNFRQAEASSAWPSTEGLVVRSEEVLRPRKPGKPPFKDVEVQYTYRVAEMVYKGEQISVGNIRMGDKAKQW